MDGPNLSADTVTTLRFGGAQRQAPNRRGASTSPGSLCHLRGKERERESDRERVTEHVCDTCHPLARRHLAGSKVRRSPGASPPGATWRRGLTSHLSMRSCERLSSQCVVARCPCPNPVLAKEVSNGRRSNQSTVLPESDLHSTTAT